MTMEVMRGMRVSIDRQFLQPPTVPISLDVLPPGFTEHPLPGGGMVVFEELTLPTIILHFGDTGIPEEVQRRLELLRTRACGQHLLGIDDLSCHRHEYIPVYMSRPPRNAQMSAERGLVYGTLDVVCKQLDLWPKMMRLDFDLAGAPNIVVGDGQFLYYPPAAGYLVGWTGYIEDSGGGGGTTQVQVRQAAKDMFATPGDYVAAGVGVGAALTNLILATDTTFVAGLPLEWDIDGIPGGANSANARLTLWAMMHQPYRSN